MRFILTLKLNGLLNHTYSPQWMLQLTDTLLLQYNIRDCQCACFNTEKVSGMDWFVFPIWLVEIWCSFITEQQNDLYCYSFLYSNAIITVPQHLNEKSHKEKYFPLLTANNSYQCMTYADCNHTLVTTKVKGSNVFFLASWQWCQYIVSFKIVSFHQKM